LVLAVLYPGDSFKYYKISQYFPGSEGQWVVWCELTTGEQLSPGCHPSYAF